MPDLKICGESEIVDSGDATYYIEDARKLLEAARVIAKEIPGTPSQVMYPLIGRALNKLTDVEEYIRNIEHE